MLIFFCPDVVCDIIPMLVSTLIVTTFVTPSLYFRVMITQELPVDEVHTGSKV